MTEQRHLKLFYQRQSEFEEIYTWCIHEFTATKREHKGRWRRLAPERKIIQCSILLLYEKDQPTFLYMTVMGAASSADEKVAWISFFPTSKEKTALIWIEQTQCHFLNICFARNPPTHRSVFNKGKLSLASQSITANAAFANMLNALESLRHVLIKRVPSWLTLQLGCS